MQKNTIEIPQLNEAHQPLLQQHDVSGSFKLTASQRKHFIRIWSGCTLLFNDIGLDDVKNIDISEIEKLENIKARSADKLLKSDPSFSNTKDVFEYVVKNYR